MNLRRRTALTTTLLALLALLCLLPTAQAFHHPRLGRFVQRDPLGYVDGMGLYEYVRSCPPGYGDPRGLYGQTTHQQHMREEAVRLHMGRNLNATREDFPDDLATEIANANEGADHGFRDAPTHGVISYITFGIFGGGWEDHFPGARRPWLWLLVSRDRSHANYVYPGFRNRMVVRKIWDAIASCNAVRMGRALHTLQDSYSHEGWPEAGFHPEWFDPQIGSIRNPAAHVNWDWIPANRFEDPQTHDQRLQSPRAQDPPNYGMHEAMQAGRTWRDFYVESRAHWGRNRRRRNPLNQARRDVDDPLSDMNRYNRMMWDVRLMLAEFKRHCCREINGIWENQGLPHQP